MKKEAKNGHVEIFSPSGGEYTKKREPKKHRIGHSVEVCEQNRSPC